MPYLHLYKKILEYTNDAIVVVGENDQVLEYNKSWINLWQDDSYKTNSFTELISQLSSLTSSPEYVKTSFKSGNTESFKFQVEDKLVFAKQQIVQDKDGKNFRLWLLKTAIETIQTKELSAEVLQLKNLINELPDQILWKDKNMIVQGCNNNFTKVYGAPREEIIGKSYEDMNLDPQTIDYIRNAELNMVRENIDYQDVEESIMKNGVEAIVLTQRKLLRDKDGNFNGMLIFFKDITERRRLENEIASKNEQLIQSAQLGALGEMANGLGHHINNPLAVLDATLAALKKSINSKEIDREECNYFVQEAQNSLNRISTLAKTLRGLSHRIEDELMEPISMPKKIQNVLTLWEEKARMSSIKIEFENNLNDELILGDRSLMTQVLVHLLNNAFDVLKSCDGDRWIKFKTHMIHPGCLTLEVSNSGPGIPEHVKNSLFNPFFSTKEIGNGAGIGLSLCKAIIEKHHGKIFLNKDAKNTTFTIELPLLVT